MKSDKPSENTQTIEELEEDILRLENQLSQLLYSKIAKHTSYQITAAHVKEKIQQKRNKIAELQKGNSNK